MKNFKLLVVFSLFIFPLCSFAKDVPAKPQYSPDGQCVSLSTSTLTISACNNANVRVISNSSSRSYVLTPILDFKNFSIRSCALTSHDGVVSDYVNLTCPEFSVAYDTNRSDFSFRTDLERKFKIEEN